MLILVEASNPKASFLPCDFIEFKKELIASLPESFL
jgi:hypothetical protein